MIASYWSKMHNFQSNHVWKVKVSLNIKIRKFKNFLKNVDNFEQLQPFSLHTNSTEIFKLCFLMNYFCHLSISLSDHFLKIKTRYFFRKFFKCHIIVGKSWMSQNRNNCFLKFEIIWNSSQWKYFSHKTHKLIVMFLNVS